MSPLNISFRPSASPFAAVYKLILHGWATLTGKYNAGLSFSIDRNNWLAPLLRFFEKWPAEKPRSFDSALRGPRPELPLKHFPLNHSYYSRKATKDGHPRAVRPVAVLTR